MPLFAIIIRAEGALADTEYVRRRAYQQVFSEAGFAWDQDRTRFAETAQLDGPQRMAHFVRRSLKGAPETEDVGLLVKTMLRRADQIFDERITSGTIDARPGIRELAIAARAEGIKLVLATSLPRAASAKLLQNAAGSRLKEAFEIIPGPPCAEVQHRDTRLYAEVAASLGCKPRHALVIEATDSGAIGARAAGFPVIITRKAVNRPAAGDFVEVDALTSLVGLDESHRLDPLEPHQAGELLAILQRFHAGNCENKSDLDRTSDMRVADILKTKGSAVKTIEPDATIRALAASLEFEAVGAMLVTADGGRLVGIISERDIARGLAEFGDELGRMHVSDLMTRTISTCTPDDSVASVASLMTQRRVRHIPVVVNNRLVGLVSIGDVLKHRLDEAQLEANVLRDFALARR